MALWSRASITTSARQFEIVVEVYLPAFQPFEKGIRGIAHRPRDRIGGLRPLLEPVRAVGGRGAV